VARGWNTPPWEPEEKGRRLVTAFGRDNEIRDLRGGEAEKEKSLKNCFWGGKADEGVMKTREEEGVN